VSPSVPGEEWVCDQDQARLSGRQLLEVGPQVRREYLDGSATALRAATDLTHCVVGLVLQLVQTGAQLLDVGSVGLDAGSVDPDAGSVDPDAGSVD
jgi:hypothetical protein